MLINEVCAIWGSVARRPALQVSRVGSVHRSRRPSSRFPERSHHRDGVRDRGYHQVTIDDVRPGTRYRYRLAEGREFADPASVSSRKVSTVPVKSSLRIFRGPMKTGGAFRWKATSSMNCTPEPSHLKAPSTRSFPDSTISFNSASPPSNSCPSPNSLASETGGMTASSIRGAEQLRWAGWSEATRRRLSSEESRCHSGRRL